MRTSQHLLLDIRKNCRKQSNRNEIVQASVLRASWEQICELFNMLKYEPYIDDQLEIDEVWNICEALIRRGRLEEESWELRENILRNMISHEFYDCYGCYDPVKKLADQLYITETEILKYADMLNEHDYYAREAAELYRQHGRMEQYIRYLETHLDRSSKEYVELIQCYSSNGNDAGARTTAELGLKKCKDDLTELFIFLLQDAKKCGDEAMYKKLLASAKRRKKVDINKINEIITQCRDI